MLYPNAVIRSLVVLVICFAHLHSAAQRYPDQIFVPNIKTVKLNKYGDPFSYPIIALNSSDRLELHFDDMDANIKSYYYTIELCDADWKPALMSFLDYARGFTNVRITTYRNSAIALTRYTHYQATFPDRDLAPTKTGNYVLKVFLNGDSSKMIISRRFLVVDPRISIAAQIQQPFNPDLFRSHQLVHVAINTPAVNVTYPNQIRVFVLQNNRWDNCIHDLTPTLMRNAYYEYNMENQCVMPGGKEWRWLDLRSFRLLSDRVSRQENTNTSNELFTKQEYPRPGQRYVYFRDNNGMYISETTEGLNPYWNADYAKVHFSFQPTDKLPYEGKNLCIFGEMTNYGMGDGAKLSWNESTQSYETTLFLKQGYYDYIYGLTDPNDPHHKFTSDVTEGDSWETENMYTVLIYYRDLGGRYDQLLGIAFLNSMLNRPGN